MKKKNFKKIVVTLLFLISFIGCDVMDDPVLHSLPLISNDSVKVTKIWDTDKYCAFTSLIKYQGKYYCAFREGVGHAGDNGCIRILISSDAIKWESRFCLSLNGYDLRDPNLSITPDGRLMLLCGRQLPNYQTETVVSFLDSEESEFSAFQEVVLPDFIKDNSNWIWRATWVNGVCYGVKYGGHFANVLKSIDGVNWTFVTSFEAWDAGEVQLQLLNNGDMVALMRTSGYGRICYSSSPYKDWTIRMTNVFLQGQNFVVSSNDRIVCVSRNVHEDAVKTSLYCSVSENNLAKLFDFPSGGDTSYAGILVESDRILVSYYSSHISSGDIFIAEIPMKCFMDRDILF